LLLADFVLRHFVITLISLGPQNERCNEVSV